MIFWGHAPNSQTRGVEMKKAMEKLDLLPDEVFEKAAHEQLDLPVLGR